MFNVTSHLGNSDEMPFTHESEWINIVTTPNPGEDAGVDHSTLLVGISHGTVTAIVWQFLIKLSIHKFLIKLTIGPSKYTLEHLSQRNDNLCSHQHLYRNVHCTFICNSQKNWKETPIHQQEGHKHHTWNTTQPYKEPTANTHNNLDRLPENYAV